MAKKKHKKTGNSGIKYSISEGANYTFVRMPVMIDLSVMPLLEAFTNLIESNRVYGILPALNPSLPIYPHEALEILLDEYLPKLIVEESLNLEKTVHALKSQASASARH